MDTVICDKSGKIHIDDPWVLSFKLDRGYTLCGKPWVLQEGWTRGEPIEEEELESEENMCKVCLQIVRKLL